MNDMIVEVETKVDLNALAFSLNETQAKNLILAVDLAQADGEFSFDVIKSLVHSLLGDYTRKDIRDFLKELRKEFK